MKRKRVKAEETNTAQADEILPEYDFRDARPNKYAARYAAGSIVVVLEPDVALRPVGPDGIAAESRLA